MSDKNIGIWIFSILSIGIFSILTISTPMSNITPSGIEFIDDRSISE